MAVGLRRSILVWRPRWSGQVASLMKELKAGGSWDGGSAFCVGTSE